MKPKPSTSSATLARKASPTPRSLAPALHANTWHYFFNREQIKPGSIVVFDFAADLDHMTMDITRTFNIDGKFTPEQAKWYNVDLECQKAVIDMLKVGNTYEQAADAGKEGIRPGGDRLAVVRLAGTFRRSGHARRDAGQRARSKPGRSSRLSLSSSFPTSTGTSAWKTPS